jgi:hypothetical protein
MKSFSKAFSEFTTWKARGMNPKLIWDSIAQTYLVTLCYMHYNGYERVL